MSQTPFGLLTDWDVDNWGNVFDHHQRGSQTPFGLLTDWDEDHELSRVLPILVSNAFRLADGLGLIDRKEDGSEEEITSQTPFGLLTDWDTPREELLSQLKEAERSQTPFGLLTDWDSAI